MRAIHSATDKNGNPLVEDDSEKDPEAIAAEKDAEAKLETQRKAAESAAPKKFELPLRTSSLCIADI